MIIVTVELWPHGDASRKQHLGTAKIANDGSGTLSDGNYDVVLSKSGKPSQVWKRGRVEGFKRLKRGPWDLLHLALKSIIEKQVADTKNDSLPR